MTVKDNGSGLQEFSGTDMYDRGATIKVGIGITAGIGLLIFGYLWLTQFKIHKTRYYYKVKLTEAAWLNKGDPVTILGIPKGRIQDIKLYSDSVIAIIWIEDYMLRKGAIARVESRGIIGQMRMSLTLGKGDTIPQWSTIPGITEKDIGEVISNIGQFIARTDSFLLVAQDILSNLQGVLVGTQSELGMTLKETRNALVTLQSSIHDLIGLVNHEMVQIDTTIRTLSSAITKTDSLLGTLAKGKGTIGKLLNDETIYLRVDSSLKALDELLRDIKANPGRYITIKIF